MTTCEGTSRKRKPVPVVVHTGKFHGMTQPKNEIRAHETPCTNHVSHLLSPEHRCKEEETPY